jgi:hypothetical protein
MKKIFFSLLIGAVITSQAYADDEVAATHPEQDAPAIEKKCDEPKFKKCEKCFELRKKNREERMAKRKARMEELKKKKAEGKTDFEKKDRERKEPIFCDECKEKFKDRKPKARRWKRDGKKDLKPKSDKAPEAPTPVAE